MDPEHSQPRQRRPRITLTPRQREVMSAIANGKTNGQIADDLGISLDGVKYHVREIFALLGVDTREEAAEWWRQQHGMRARMPVVSNLVRMPALVRLSLLGGGGAAAIAGIVVLAAIAGPPKTADSPLNPGVWTVLAEPVDDVVCTGGSMGDALCTSDSQRLVVLNEHGIEERQLGDIADWTTLRWSPDGTSVAAVEGVDATGSAPRGRLHVFDLASGSHRTAPIAGPNGKIEWSSDSEHILLTGTDVLTIYDRSLADATNLGHGEAVWSADDSRLLIVAGDNVRIIDTSGRVLESGNIAAITGELAPAPHSVFPIAMDGSNFTLGLAGGQPGDEVATWRVEGVVDGEGLSWSPAILAGIHELTWRFLRNGDHQRILAQEPGAFGGECRGSCTSSDGELTYLVLFEASSGPDPASYNLARHPRYVGWAAQGTAGWFASEGLARSRGATPLDLVYVPE